MEHGCVVLPSKLSIVHAIGYVSKASMWSFNTQAFTFCYCPCSPSSTATSVVFVIASSNSAFTLILFLPFFKYTGFFFLGLLLFLCRIYFDQLIHYSPWVPLINLLPHVCTLHVCCFFLPFQIPKSCNPPTNICCYKGPSS